MLVLIFMIIIFIMMLVMMHVMVLMVMFDPVLFYEYSFITAGEQKNGKSKCKRYYD